ncbi:cytochrome b/b6 domain-containing protein [Azovibrio restrictus]|uniref:cytochrome b/b6 domain-containing protein n=1 Tax=Azovibrio restrictus TaxID=146938 RepID=UPI0026F1347F|nr:cytochrome b/b6 domain-containing protein [Azovibrio restrictus]
MRRIRLWDLPTRLFHWLLVAAVLALFVTGKVGGNAIEWHGRIGHFVVGLIAFRLVWGFVGSTYARFGQFFPTPGRVAAYLRGEWQGLGHNPLGALSVFALLGLVGLQALLGLFTNDDIAFRGPLYNLVGGELSSRLTGLHHLLADVLLGFVVLHVGAILFHVHVKKDNLVRPMLTGWKEAEQGEPARGGGLVALLFALAVAGLALWGAAGSWIPAPPPPPAVETPAW